MQNTMPTFELAFLTGMNRDQLKEFLSEIVKDAVAELLGPKRLGAAAQNADDEAMVTVAEAARITGLAVNTLYEKTHLKAIPHYKKGKRLYFRVSELLAWIAKGRVRTQAETEAIAATHVLNHRQGTLGGVKSRNGRK